MIRKLMIAAIVFAVTLAPCALAQDIAGSADHPMVSRYPGQVIGWHRIENFMPYKVPTGPVEGYRTIPKFEQAEGRVTRKVADDALKMLDVDPVGLDVMDRKLLQAVIDKFGGGPVGVDNLAAAIGEERDTIEDVLEPYLIQQGYLQRTLRGRVATAAAYRHFGLAAPRADGARDLWDSGTSAP